MLDVILILFLFVLALYWWDTTYCQELVVKHCQHECERTQVQLLDSTVSRQRLWLRRNEKGQVELCRLYSFEFCGDHESRHSGYVVLLGRRIAETSMEAWRLPR